MSVEGEYKALAFAQFLKRLTYDDVRGCAVDKEETEVMLGVIQNIQEQLAKQGVAPR